MATETYDGPVCYVGHDHIASDGQQLEGGWHYTVVPDDDAKAMALAHAQAVLARAKKFHLRPLVASAQAEIDEIQERNFEKPGEKLYLSEKTGKYRLARDGDESWHARHHQRLATIAIDGNLADVRTDEELDAAHRHLDNLEERLNGEGLHDHEHDHMLRTPEDVQYMRRQLERRPS